ncbi:MAG TPA: SDR family oxidoreductase [Williamwhitmania sp.]|nr:SDR family oxidoreductase [Williamwhitmania sp.]
MKKTILITGASSGIGRGTALYFAAKGWNVAATMRTPENEVDLGLVEGIKLFRLDVTKPETIRQAIDETINTFGALDVVVNNAGYGGVGVFEAASPEQIQRQFDTNVFGVMNVIREVLPYFREHRRGTIVNVTSVGGLITFPIYSVYHATKWAVEGFAEALQYELRPFNIRIKNIEPGAIKTDFYDRSQDLFKKDGLTEYDSYAQVTLANAQKVGQDAPGPHVVAKKIYQAATSSNYRLRYAAGPQAPALLVLRWLLPLCWFRGIVRMVVEKGYRSK